MMITIMMITMILALSTSGKYQGPWKEEALWLRRRQALHGEDVNIFLHGEDVKWTESLWLYLSYIDFTNKQLSDSMKDDFVHKPNIHLIIIRDLISNTKSCQLFQSWQSLNKGSKNKSSKCVTCKNKQQLLADQGLAANVLCEKTTSWIWRRKVKSEQLDW